jgi:hypothetical protein
MEGDMDILKARVAFGPMALVTHCRKTTATGVPSWITLGFEKTGPNPFATYISHPAAISLMCEHTSLNCPSKKHNSKDRHDARLDDKKVSQLRHLQVQQWQL